MLLCKFCGKECKNDNSLKNHERLCKNNIARQPLTWDGSGRRGKSGGNQYTKAKRLGIEPPKMSDETRQKISNAAKNQIWDESRRLKHSQSMKKAVLENPESYTSKNVCGRVKIEDYCGEKFHGKWELETAIWLDKNNIKWERKVNPFNYFWNNAWHLYFPDFYLPKLNVYLEVKGYETERDKCKWNSVFNLVIFKKNEIQLLRKDSNALVTHLVESARLITEEAGFKSLTEHQNK